ncbi:ECF transporter S component [Massiliimalia massiliensis]|jgi:riboflavin transporter FmnP|uniref:ECF transporter S component n=1 Tax=Massiliimalia massiliensis TaxID=1852384 RepID=UPI000984728C|nr:ECF transporter S component [Massiliimalia massiliensis]
MQQKSTEKTRFITLVGMLSALATVLYYIGEVPMPFAANLKIGFSDLPALIGAIVAGPWAGVAVEVVKNILHLFRTDSFGIGEIANCVVGIGMVVPFSLLFRKLKEKHNLYLAYFLASLGSLVGIVISGLIINAIVYPIFVALIGGIIESPAAFLIYLGGTVITNLIKWVVTLVPIAFFVKLLLKIRVFAHA